MSEKSTQNRWLLVVGLVVGLFLLCLCLAGVVWAGFYVYTSRATTIAEPPAVAYILDVSDRMRLPAEGAVGSRHEVARGVMAELIRPNPPEMQSSLRVFGSGAQPISCEDTALLLALGQNNHNQLADTLSDLAQGATTEAALVEAMVAAIVNLAPASGPRSLVVVTGGQDDCRVEAAQLVADEAARAGIELRTFVIGFQVPVEQQAAIKLLAEAAGEGIYLDAPDAQSLREAFRAVQRYVQAPSDELFTAVQLTAVAIEVAQAVTPVAPTPALTPGAPATPAPSDTETAVTPTPSPTPEPDLTATAVAVGDDVGQTACDHPYFPLRPGATWVYEGSSAGEAMSMTWTVIEVTGDRSSAAAIMQANFSDMFSATYTWQCDSSGIVSFDYGNFAFEGLDFEMEDISFTTEVRDQSGILIPPPGQFAPGASWNSAFTVRTSANMAGFAFTMDFATSSSYTATASESVTVPAGTFSALRVESTGVSTSSNSMAPGLDVSSSSSGTTWYGRGVGWLRMITIDDGERTNWDLVRYSIP
jgi:hypothetical protein